jgi:acetyl-CoA carboxylase biotin carboxyl carrier protein
MLKIQEIREIIKLVDQSTLEEFVYEHEGSKIQLKKQVEPKTVTTYVQNAVDPVAQPTAQPVQAAAPVKEAQPVVESKTETHSTDNLHKITSPMVGTFYASPSPDAGVYVSVGDKVKENTVVCIVEAMKLFNEIEAEVDGEIVEILAENGQLIEYGQPLFLVKK